MTDAEIRAELEYWDRARSPKSELLPPPERMGAHPDLWVWALREILALREELAYRDILARHLAK